MITRQPITRGEGVGLIGGLILFLVLQQGYLHGPIAASGPFGATKGFLDAQFWIFTANHAEHGFAVTHGLPVWQVLPDGALAVHNSHPPAVSVMQAAAAQFAGATPAAARWPALIFSTALLALVYLLLRRAFPRLPTSLAVIGLMAQPMFFHFATCPEVFLMGHLPLIAVLAIALFGFRPAPPIPPPAPQLVPQPIAHPPLAAPAVGTALMIDTVLSAPAAPALTPEQTESVTRQIARNQRRSTRQRCLALSLAAAAAVLVSYPALAVLVLWAAAWWGFKRTRAAAGEALSALAGAALALGLALLWLHGGGGSVAHWADRGLFRLFGPQQDIPDLADPAAADSIAWLNLLMRQWVRTFQAQGWLAWLGLIGCCLSLVPLRPGRLVDAAGRDLRAQRALLIGLAILLLTEAVLVKQNAWTHLYTVSAAGFLSAFGLAVIGEHALLGFQNIAVARSDQAASGLRRLRATYVMGILLALASLGAIFQASEIIDTQQTETQAADVAPLAVAIDQAQQDHPGPVLVFDDWLRPARLVTGQDEPPTVGYIFPWFYRSRAFLCYRRPQIGPQDFSGPDRPSVVLWPESKSFDNSTVRTVAIRAELVRQGYRLQTIQGVNIYTLATARRTVPQSPPPPPLPPRDLTPPLAPPHSPAPEPAP